MKNILNGYQCGTCKTIYLEETDAIECEKKTLETPLIPIGTVLTEGYEEEFSKVRVSRIYYEMHNVCYRFESEYESEWSDCFSYFGNEHLISSFGDQILNNQ